MEHKQILGWITLIIGLSGFVPYCVSTFQGKTKPHAFSWFIWAIISAVAFLGQYVKGAGPGAWPAALGALACFFAAILGLIYGSRYIRRIDWLTFGLALATVPAWYFEKDPLLSMILVVVINTLGSIPSLRKSYHAPHSERIILYFTNVLQFVIALFALENYSVVTVLYPATVAATNLSFIILLLVRRRFHPADGLVSLSPG